MRVVSRKLRRMQHVTLKMSEVMLIVIDNVSLRNALIQRGNVRIRNFSWEKSADRHMAVYKSLL